jgi:hypothetical protein
MRYVKVYDDLLNDPTLQRLKPKEFKRLFLEAIGFLACEPDNPFADFIKGPFDDQGRLPAQEWRVIRQRIFERDGYTCNYCGVHGAKLECDHVVPLSRGGTNDDDNLVTACRSCNRSKHAKLVEEWTR